VDQLDQLTDVSEAFKLELTCPACHRKFTPEQGQAVCPDDGTPLTSLHSDPLLGTTIVDRYEIISVLGTGAWGVIYKARHTALNRPVAIKVLHAHLCNAHKLKRFEQEARAASLLRHQNVCTVHDLGVLPSGQPYLVMDYLEGKTLKDLLVSDDKLPYDRALPIFMQVCSALAAAHEKGVIHRDIKPSNILTHDASGKQHVVVLDFGLAKLLSPDEGATQLTETGQTMGTPAYMSPEQCQGLSVDGRTDIYALGCVMYETITGSVPFTGSTAYQCMMQHSSQLPELPSSKELAAPLPDMLEQIILKALEKDPIKRFQTAQELSDALSKVATTSNDSPMSAAISGANKKIRALKRRVSQVKFAHIALGVLTAALGAALFFNWQNHSVSPSESSSVPPNPRASSADATVERLLSWQHGQQLRQMKLSNSDLTDTGFRLLGRLPNLELIDAVRTKITDKSMSALSKLTGLKHLDLSYNNISDKACDYIKDDRSLEELCLEAVSLTDASAAPLSNLAQLRVLDLNGTALSDQGAKQFASLKDLSILELGNTKLNGECLDALSTLPKLRVLDLQNTHIGDQAIERLPLHLLQLDLNGCELTTAGLKKLSRLQSLEQLNISSTPASASSVEDLAALHRLKFLSLSGRQVTDDSIARIDKLENLETLDLHDSRVSDRSLPAVCKLSRLCELNLKGTAITDRGIAELPKLAATLESLSLNHCAITDAAMTPLKSLTRLHKLSLDGARLSAAGLEQLSSLPRLESLTISGGNLTTSQLTSLKALMPRTRIVTHN
jgi:serine/threonine protein kinase